MQLNYWIRKISKEKDYKSWCVAYTLLLVIGILLIIRAHFGMDYTDESFYFALAKRFYQGDQLLVDEWFPTQLIGTLLLPFYSIYVKLNGDQTGMILAARIAYVIFSVGIGCYMLSIMRKQKKQVIYSFLVSIMFVLYVRAGIGTFSYYSLGLETFLLSILLCTDKTSSEKMYLKWVLSGINFAISVLCMPYMIIMFTVLVIWYFIRNRGIKKDGICFLTGIGSAAFLFLMRFGMEAVKGLENISDILRDPQHQTSALENVRALFAYLTFNYLKYTWLLYIFTFIAGIVLYIRKKQDGCCRIYIGILYLEFFIQAAYSRTFFEGGIVYAVLLLAIQIWFVKPERYEEEKYLFLGILFGIIWSMGSNVGMRVFNMGVLIADIWSLRILMDHIVSIKKITIHMGLYICIGLISILAVNRFSDIYRDNSIEQLKVKVAYGSMKGIYTTASRAAEYETAWKELQRYTEKDDRIAVQNLNPWAYLDSAAKCGSYSVWNVDYTDIRAVKYYDKYPENIPTVIYLPRPGFGKYEGVKWGSHGSDTDGKGSEQLEGYLQKLVSTAGYEKIQGESGCFYKLVKIP